ncbi:MAG: type IV pilus modification protein PilV [Betaproteobacteria bacterium RIFCSPLOWO2_12_FULL_65_14]|nr:MAG: type IV pilus modification protein PilV [Betaproteobacteria bacterium RIFCSPLOWO2_12_FULL_65_14]
MLRRNLQPARSCRGATMIEVLVTFLIVTLGLLGAAGMQSRLQIAELESYQRAQAIILLQDMVDRINANRRNVASYVTADPVGTGNTSLACSAPATTAARDLCEWHQALQGSTETSSGNPVGAMIGARGCVELAVAAMPREAVVAVVWQGVTPTVAPASTTCGSTAFTQANARRAMIARVKIGCLQNDPTTGVCVTP